MPPAAPRKYGKKSTRSKAERLFTELPQSPVRAPANVLNMKDKPVDFLTEKLAEVKLEDGKRPQRTSRRKANKPEESTDAAYAAPLPEDSVKASPEKVEQTTSSENEGTQALEKSTVPKTPDLSPSTAESIPAPPAEATMDAFGEDGLRLLTWADVCPHGDSIVKIAEASYAEVYRVTNERGTSIIKVIRLESPIKPQTKTQVKFGLIDEEPRSEAEVRGELQISEWLADIPGFVVYKERYLVKGKATKHLLDTHQTFQKRMKRQDPGRAQFYPSPSRYLDDTKFLVVELGDAGSALEDWKLESESQLWDIFFLEAIALARAEELAMFEHRDLHEGNLCVKQTSPPRERESDSSGYFGYSGLDITILDYGLSRAEDLSIDFAKPVAYDLDKDLSMFTSTHAPQCKVYRQMRSFLLRADRQCLPPEEHNTPYAKGIDGPLSWEAYAPYTNVLWLAYLYQYLILNFAGDKKEALRFRKATREMWAYLNPDAPEDVPCFGSSADIVCFAVEAGWIREDQLMEGSLMLEREDREDSIILPRDDIDGDADASLMRRSPRRRQTVKV